MAGYFFDSSATVKRYVREAGTSWVINLFRFSNQDVFYFARITLVEVISAFSRRLRSGSLSQKQTSKAIKRFRHTFEEKFFKIDADKNLIEKAAGLAKDIFCAVMMPSNLQRRLKQIIREFPSVLRL